MYVCVDVGAFTIHALYRRISRRRSRSCGDALLLETLALIDWLSARRRIIKGSDFYTSWRETGVRHVGSIWYTIVCLLLFGVVYLFPRDEKLWKEKRLFVYALSTVRSEREMKTYPEYSLTSSWPLTRQRNFQSRKKETLHSL